MKNALDFPPTLVFSSPPQRQFAEKFKAYLSPFFEGGILANPLNGWENVFFHCLSEAWTVKLLCDRMGTVDAEGLVLAAFLHDAAKRREVEAVNAAPIDQHLAFQNSERDAKDWLQQFRVPTKALELQNAFGDEAARMIWTNQSDNFEFRLLHYVDDITQGDQIVTIEDRMTVLELNPRYRQQNEWHRKFFDGQTLYQAKRIIGKVTESALKQHLEIGESDSLVDWLRSRHFPTSRC